MRSRVARAAVLIAAAVVATGCGGGADPGSRGGSGPSSPTSATTTDGLASRDVQAATGRLVKGTVLSYRLPAGVSWRFGNGPDFASNIDQQGGWQVSYSEVPAGDATEAEFARGMISDLRPSYGKTLRRLPDRQVDGHSGVVLEAHKPQQYVYVWYPVVGSTVAGFHFEAPSDSPKAQQMIESVLASIEWEE